VQQPADGGLAGGVHSSERLVQKQQPCILCDPARHERSLALPTGESPDLPMSEARQANPLDGLGHRLPVGGPGAPGESQRAVAAHHHDFPHRDWKVPIHRFRLWNVRDLVGQPRPFGSAVEQADAARVQPGEPHQRVEEGRLARPVHAEQPHDLATADGESDVVERGHVAVAHGHVAHFDRGCETGDGRCRAVAVQAGVGGHGFHSVSPFTIVRMS